MSGDRRGANIAALEELSRMFSKHSRALDALIKDLNGRTVGSTERSEERRVGKSVP